MKVKRIVANPACRQSPHWKSSNTILLKVPDLMLSLEIIQSERLIRVPM